MRSAFHRWLLRLVPLGIGLALGSAAYGAPYTVKNADPQSFAEVRKVTTGEVPNDLGRAQCGGWNMETSVEDYISDVQGVPGRKGIWDGNIESGLAERNMDGGQFDDGYYFPNNSQVTGLSTTCRLQDLQNGNGFPRPERLENCEAEGTCNALCTDLNAFHYKINDPQKRCIFRGVNAPYEPGWAYCCTGDLVPEPGSKTPQDPEFLALNCISCRGDGAVFEGETEDFNGENIKREVRDQTGCRWGQTVEALKADVLGGPLPKGDIPEDATELPDPLTGDLEAAAQGNELGRRYVSFFRDYIASYKREKLEETPFDRNERANIKLQCFGIYKEGIQEEYDPKYYKVEDEELQCAIVSDFSPYVFSQKSKGQLKTEIDDPSSPVIDRDFNEEEDLWFPDVGDAISLLNTKLLKEKYNSNLSFALLAPDKANQEATVQISKNIPLSSGSILRAFDDTVTTDEKNEKKPDPTGRDDRRTVVEWWQQMETRANTIMTPPLVRMVLPELWPLGMDVLEDIFAQNGEDEPVVLRDPQTQSIEVQLHAKEDILGEVASYLQRSLIAPVEEEPIVVAIPGGSPSDYRATISAWCAWYKRVHNKNDCDGSEEPGLREFLDTLEQYAQRIDFARKLRTELALYASKIIEKQNTAGQGVRTWLEDNASQFEQYLEDRERTLGNTTFAERWREVQGLYRSMDTESMPWCRNDRFTMPIYSLDRWFPGWADVTGGLYGGGGGADRLPMLEAQRSTDVVLDFTAIKVPKQAIKLPVLKPILVRMEQRLLAEPTGKPGEQFIPTLPSLVDFDDLPSIANDSLIDSLIPTMEEGDAPSTLLTYIPDDNVFDEAATVNALDKTEELLTEMKKIYTEFWQGTFNEDNEPVFCAQHGVLPCVYLEQELMQILGRISARPAVLLKEDFESIGERRNPAEDDGGYDSCPREDWACHLLNKQKVYPPEGWRVTEIGSQEDVIDELRSKLIDETLNPESGQKFPFLGGRESLLPSYNAPRSIELIPSSSSSSAS